MTAPHTKDLPLPACSFHMMQARMLCHTFPGHPWACPQTSPSPVSKSPPSLFSRIPCAAQRQQESCLSFCGACAEEHGTTAAFPAPLPKALCCRTHSHLGTARLSWCHAGFTRGTVRERSPLAHHVLPDGFGHGTSKRRGSSNHAPDAPSHFLLDSRLAPCARISKTECKNRGWASPKHNSKLFPGKVTGAAENSSKSRGKGMSTGGTSLKVPVGPTPRRFPASPSVVQVPP